MLDRLRGLTLVSVFFILVACGSATTSSDPSPLAEPSGPPTACLGLAPADCERVLEAALAGLTASDPPVAYVQVGPFGCQVAEGCPTTLAARPEGDVIIEFGQGTGSNVHITARADGTIEATMGEAMGVAVEPTSGPAGPGPVPYALGHCGLSSGIDVDGSYWDPIGPIDWEHGDAINSAEGTFAFLDPRHATFTSKGGFVVALQRHEGAKLLPFCM
jgi:hypothetical protein